MNNNGHNNGNNKQRHFNNNKNRVQRSVVRPSSGQSQLSLNKVYDSSGPTGKVRGNAQAIYEKYQSLARDAHSSGDLVLAENYLQHAEHYLRIIHAIQEQMQQYQRNNRVPYDSEGASSKPFDSVHNDAENSDDVVIDDRYEHRPEVNNFSNHERTPRQNYERPQQPRMCEVPHEHYESDPRPVQRTASRTDRSGRADRFVKNDMTDNKNRQELNVPFLGRGNRTERSPHRRVPVTQESPIVTDKSVTEMPVDNDGTQLQTPRRRVIRRRVVSKTDANNTHNETSSPNDN